MKFRYKVSISIVVFVFIIAISFIYLLQKPIPEKILYGMSFNTLYAEELDLDWKETYDAFLDDLGVRRLRLAAHWNMVEPIDGVYNFAELDYQIARAEEVNAEVVFAIGRRLPRWPECHVPDWAANLTQKKRQEKILEYVTIVMNRYKDSPAIKYWQIENEPFLEVFAKENCGEFDEDFFVREVELFRSLDDTRPFLITDSGNLGTWAGAYKYGDVFGTSVYIHFWNPELGQFRTIIPSWFYRIKENIMELVYGDRESFLIELSAEPWLLEPIVDTDISVQYSRMDIDKLEDILKYAKDTRYEKQYLWGAEWWYYLREKGNSEMWDRGKIIFNQ